MEVFDSSYICFCKVSSHHLLHRTPISYVQEGGYASEGEIMETSQGALTHPFNLIPFVPVVQGFDQSSCVVGVDILSQE